MSNNGIIAITMPKWGLSMLEGKVMEWLVDEGTELRLGDPVMDIAEREVDPFQDHVSGHFDLQIVYLQHSLTYTKPCVPRV